MIDQTCMILCNNFEKVHVNYDNLSMAFRQNIEDRMFDLIWDQILIEILTPIVQEINTNLEEI